MNVFIVSIANESERNSNQRIRNVFEEILLLQLYSKNDDFICTYIPGLKRVWIQRPGLKTGVENNIFWSDYKVSGFGEPGGTPPPKIPRGIRTFTPGLWLYEGHNF